MIPVTTYIRCSRSGYGYLKKIHFRQCTFRYFSTGNASSSTPAARTPQGPSSNPTPSTGKRTGFSWRSVLGGFIVAAAVFDFGLYYVISDPERETKYSRTNQILLKVIPASLYNRFLPDGPVDSRIKPIRKYFNRESIPEKEEVKKDDKIFTEQKPLYILEGGLTMNKWLEIKDSLVALDDELQKLILEEKENAKQPVAKVGTEDSKSENKHKVSSKSDEDEIPSNAPTAKSNVPIVGKQASPESEKEKEISMVQVLKNKLEFLQTKAVDQEFTAQNVVRLSQDIEGNMSKDLETVLVEDLKLVSEEELKRRLVKLILEFKDRARWEAVRISNVLEVENEKMRSKTRKLLQQQEKLQAELWESEKDNMLMQAQEIIQKKLEKEKDLEIKKLKANLARKYDIELKSQQKQALIDFQKKIMEIKKKVAQANSAEMKRLKDQLHALQRRLNDAEERAKLEKNRKEFSTVVHRICTDYFNLITKVTTKQPFKVELDSLYASASDDKVLKNAIENIPESMAVTGLPTRDDLKKEYKEVHRDLSKHVLIDEENPTMFSHALASVVSRLSFDNQVEKDSKSMTDEELLSISKQAILKDNDFKKGIAALEQMKTKNKKYVEPFIKRTEDCEAADRIIKFIGLHVKKLAVEAVHN